MTESDIDRVRELVNRRAGIVLDRDKAYLIEARLTTLARKQGLASMHDVVEQLVGAKAAVMERTVIDAMTTNETSFFRDLHPFETVQRHVLPELIQRRRTERRLTIWCAASSTGQEPYTLAMIIREHFPQLKDWDVKFIASDLSRDVLARAAAGRFNQLEVNRGLPAPLLIKYFTKLGLEWEISPEIRRMIDFREVNLLESWPAMPPVDLLFIRNVLIYFSSETKKRIFQRLRGVMRDDGYLFLGVAETPLNLDDRFERQSYDKSGCYRIRARLAA